MPGPRGIHTGTKDCMSYHSTPPPSVVSPEAPGPVAEGERILAIDVLRGFALLGILVVNIQSFSMPDAALFNPTAYGDLSGANRWVWYLTHVLFDQKYMTIFSMLFGAGILLMTARAEGKGVPSTALHYRRMTVLLGFGLAHAYLIWSGDILVSYALCGFLVYLFRRRTPRVLVTLGIGSVAVSSVLSLFFGWSMPHWPEDSVKEMSEMFQPSSESIAETLAAYRGGWVSQVTYRAPWALQFQTFVFLVWTLWRAGGLMLLGMGLFKLGVFSAARSTRFYGSLVGVGAFIGVPVVVYGVRANLQVGWDVYYSFFQGTQYNYWASILVSLGWVGLVMIVCKKGMLGFITPALAAVGRTAFTNYIAQSLICTTLFYGHGFGLYGNVDRIGQALIVLAVWLIQLIASPLWLRHFRFGPLEWLWRSLTYRKIQPIRRA